MTKKMTKNMLRSKSAPLRLSKSPLEPYRHEIEVLKSKLWSNQAIADWIKTKVGLKTSEAAIRNLLSKRKLQQHLLPTKPTSSEIVKKVPEINVVEEPDYKKHIAKKVEERTEIKSKEKRFSFSGTKVTLED